MMEFVSWEYDSQYMESHSKFHGSSHHQADDKDSPHLPSPKKKTPALTRFLLAQKKIHTILIPKNPKTAIFFSEILGRYTTIFEY